MWSSSRESFFRKNKRLRLKNHISLKELMFSDNKKGQSKVKYLK